MKFTINREEFLKAILTSGKVASPSPEDPILATLKLEVFEDRLEVIGSNGEISIKSIVPKFKDDKEVLRDIKVGSILVNSKILTDVIRNLEDNEITFPVEDNALVRIQNNRFSYNLNVIRGEEYRDIDFDESGIRVELTARDLIDAVNQTAFSASIKERAVLTCLNIESNGIKVYFTATDGARLSKKEITVEEELPKFSININAKIFSEGIKTITTEEKVILFISDKNLVLKLDNTVILFTLTVGDYPNTKNIIPHNFFYKLETQANELLKVLTRVVLFSGERANIVKLTMSDSEVVVSSKSLQVGDASEKLSLYQYTGERLEISFNVKYVSEAIRSLKDETIVLSFMGEMKPFTVTSKNDDSVIQLITPVRTY